MLEYSLRKVQVVSQHYYSTCGGVRLGFAPSLVLTASAGVPAVDAACLRLPGAAAAAATAAAAMAWHSTAINGSSRVSRPAQPG